MCAEKALLFRPSESDEADATFVGHLFTELTCSFLCITNISHLKPTCDW